MQWVVSTLHTTSEHGVSSITTADAHTSAASSRLKWKPCAYTAFACRMRIFRQLSHVGKCENSHKGSCAAFFDLETFFITVTEFFLKKMRCVQVNT